MRVECQTFLLSVLSPHFSSEPWWGSCCCVTWEVMRNHIIILKIKTYIRHCFLLSQNEIKKLIKHIPAHKWNPIGFPESLSFNMCWTVHLMIEFRTCSLGNSWVGDDIDLGFPQLDMIFLVTWLWNTPWFHRLMVWSKRQDITLKVFESNFA